MSDRPGCGFRLVGLGCALMLVGMAVSFVLAPAVLLLF